MLRLLCVAGVAACGVLLPPAARAADLFAETHKDFGGAPQGQVLTHRFALKNTTGQPLHVSSLRTSCQCASASVESHDLQPGESTNVNAVVDTRKFLGSKTFAVYVLIDKPTLQEVQLTIRAESRGDISVDPGTVDFGTIKKGTAPTATAAVKFYTSNKINVTGIDNDNGYIEAKVEPLKVEGYTAYQVSLKLRKDLPAGAWQAEVWLKTDDKSSPRIRIPLYVKVEAALTASPLDVQLIASKPGTKVEKKVTIRGAAAFKILKIEGGDPAFEIKGVSDESKNAHTLTIVYTAGKSPAELQKTFKVVTDLPSENTVEFHVQGILDS